MSDYRDPVDILRDLLDSGMPYDDARIEALYQAQYLYGENPESARTEIDDSFQGASIALRERVRELFQEVGHEIGRFILRLRR